MIEKVRILEKDFPAGIPEDIGYQPLEVINEAGETVALFYSTAFMTEKFDDPVSYCRTYDDILEIYDTWRELDINNERGWSEEEHWEDYERRQEEIDKSKLDPWSVEVGYTLKMVVFGRLAYPYHFPDDYWCLEEFGEWYLNLDEEFVDFLISYGDHKLISKLMDLFLHNHIPDAVGSAEDFFNFLLKHNFAAWFESPDIFFTDENIDLYLELAQTSQNAELIAFLLDYKNKHFPSAPDYTLTLKD